ncbi:MAG: hypothetical protein QXT19_04075 [Candidatus Woesearchaeota archaeon]
MPRNGRIQQELLRLLVYYLAECEMPASSIKKQLGCSSHAIKNWYYSDRPPATRFFPEFEQRIRQAANEIARGRLCGERAYFLLLKDAPKYREKPKGYIIDPKYLHKGSEYLYADALVELWQKLKNKGRTNAYYYSPKIRGAYSGIVGWFFAIPSASLPATPQGFSGPVAFLAASYDKKKSNVFFYGPDGNGFFVPLVVHPSRRYPEPMPLPEREISDICLAFFRQKNYDLSSDLRTQAFFRVFGDGNNDVRYTSNYSRIPHRAPRNGSLTEAL